MVSFQRVHVTQRKKLITKIEFKDTLEEYRLNLSNDPKISKQSPSKLEKNSKKTHPNVKGLTMWIEELSPTSNFDLKY